MSNMLEERQGDLFASGLKAICHGCNTKGSMGAGIAREFAVRYPKMCVEYQRLCRSYRFSLGELFLYEAPDQKIIGNLATQENFGACAELDAIKTSMGRFLKEASTRGIKEIGAPKIGCGLGGLSWQDVKPIFEELASSHNVKIIVYYILR